MAIRVVDANFADQGKGKAPAESFGLRQRKTNKRVRQDTVMKFDDERTMEGDVPELKKKKKKRCITTPRQPAHGLGTAHSSPYPDVNKVTYYLLSLLFDSDYLQTLMLVQTLFCLAILSTSTLQPSRNN